MDAVEEEILWLKHFRPLSQEDRQRNYRKNFVCNMAKKKGSLAHKEIYQRINFLYQAAYLTLTANPSDLGLCRFYTSTLKALAQRLVLRLHPHIKRSICRKCHVLLVPGITTTVRIKAEGDKFSEVKCLECGRRCRFLNKKNYQPWFENPEAWIT